jgi:hypothetical protein
MGDVVAGDRAARTMRHTGARLPWSTRTRASSAPGARPERQLRPRSVSSSPHPGWIARPREGATDGRGLTVRCVVAPRWGAVGRWAIEPSAGRVLVEASDAFLPRLGSGRDLVRATRASATDRGFRPERVAPR